MYHKPRIWLVISLLCFLGAAVFWELGNREAARRRVAPKVSPAEPTPAAATNPTSIAPAQSMLLSSHVGSVAYVRSNQFPEPKDSKHPLRLRNSSTSLADLSRRENALLLANALLDLSQPLALAVPEKLQLKGETKSYVVQSRTKVDDRFRQLLKDAGAEVVSYVPNNALLVRMDSQKTGLLNASPMVSAVVAWQPYFKLAEPLLKNVIQESSVDAEAAVRLLVYPNELNDALSDLKSLGTEILTQNRSPFGTQLTLRLGKATLTDLAQNDRIQWVEPYVPPRLANDLTGLLLGSSTNNGITNQYLGLTGKGIRVNVNDTGIDVSNPDIGARVSGGDPAAAFDLEGHGTHVAGIIASSGLNGPAAGTNMPPGSATNATFQGKAPEAILIPLLIDPFIGSFQSDAYLQETAAQEGALISNNSWGYLGVNEYDSAAASYDQAVRDALPGVQGSQPMVYVFAAGNSGAGSSSGVGGDADSISSPATAKNVITVGAIESLRNISNGPVTTNDFGESATNFFFLADTDSNDQIADYSSRGNVGIGLEGEFGRFKPDVVAPGSFIISTRSSTWKTPKFVQNFLPLFLRNQTVEAGSTNFYTLEVPENATDVRIRTIPNTQSADPFPGLLIALGASGSDPFASALGLGTNQLRAKITGPNIYNVGVFDRENQPVNFDLMAVITVTNATLTSDYFDALDALNKPLEPYYRYESGTSMAAPAISGLLAQVEDFFTNRLAYSNAPSPALLKAMLINSTTLVGENYDRQVQSSLNYQGWGRPLLQRMIPEVMDTQRGSPEAWPIKFYDQDALKGLATGESDTRILNLDTNNALGIAADLNITLVWTDPPGNPAVGIKLVNDLDLIVTNLTSGEVFYGNNIPSRSAVNVASGTNTPAADDIVNNVENVFMRGPLGDQYSVTVRAKRVNVNAVTAHPDGIVQDYALVIACGDTTVTNFFQKIDEPTDPRKQSGPLAKNLTNGIPLLNERVGANSPLSATTNGNVSQWNFYTFVNTGDTNPYVAIATFQAINISRPRLGESDVDLYVSTDPNLFTLDPKVLADAADNGPFSYPGSSRTRGGSELVTFTNGAPDVTYYIAVKSEDQQAGEYALVAIASSEPFNKLQPNGCVIVKFPQVPAAIPDGANDSPQGVFGIGPSVYVGIGAHGSLVRNVVVTNVIRHDDFGDLTGILKGPSGPEVTLYAHTLRNIPSGTLAQIVLDDGGSRSAIHSEGPVRLNALRGVSTIGVWQLAVYDNAPFHTGVLTNAAVCLQPQDPSCFTDVGCVITLEPESWYYDFIDVPFDATKLQVCISEATGPVEVYLKRGVESPTRDDWDAFQVFNPGAGDCLTLDQFSSPPLIPGRYQLGIYNPSADASVSFRLKILVTRGLLSDSYFTYVQTNNTLTLTDDAKTFSQLYIPTNRLIIDARVGIRLDHPRVSDLAIHLVTPRGTRWLLAEDRGGSSATALGRDLGPYPFSGTPDQILTNYSWATFSDSTNLSQGPFKFTSPPFRNPSLLPQPIVFQDDFEAIPQGNYKFGDPVLGGYWLVLTNGVGIVVDSRDPVSHGQVLALSYGGLVTPLPIRGEKQYVLSFAYRKDSSSVIQQISNSVAAVSGSTALTTDLTISPAQVVPKLRLAPGQLLTLRTSTNASILVNGITPVDANGQTNVAFRGLPAYSLIGQWSYSATMLSTQTAWGSPFFIGANTNYVTVAPSAPGDYYLWLAINAPGGSTVSGNVPVLGEWKQAQGDSFQYVLSGVTNTLYAQEYWQTNRVRFIGREDDTTLQFLSDWNTTTLIDSVLVTEPISAAFYLTEEPLPNTITFQSAVSGAGSGTLVQVPSVKGETAQGTWKLEIQDTRALPGSGGVLPNLKSWYLQLLFAPNQQAIPLTNCVEYTDLVRRSGIRYYVVYPPKEALQTTNTLLVSSSPLRFFYNKDTLPDPEVDEVSSADPLILDRGIGYTPGQPYFLAVMNSDPTTVSNQFTIRADFRLPMTTFVGGVPATLQGTNYSAFANRFLVSSNFLVLSNLSYPGTNIHWYKYTVAASSNLTAAVFELHSTNKELHLVAKRGLADPDYLPTPTRYDYHSINFDNTSEVIIVRSNSYPVPLTGIPWILGVYNSGTNEGNYTISGTRWIADPPFSPPYTAPLPTYVINTGWNAGNTTNVPLPFTLGPGESLNYFYQFPTDASQSGVLFELTGLNGDADLRVRRADLPSTSLFDFSDLHLGTNSESIALHTNVFIPTLGSPTNWFINVVNHDSITVSGSIHVATVTGTNALPSAVPLLVIPAAVPTASGMVLSWRAVPGERYEIRAADRDIGPFNTVVGSLVARTSSVTFTDPSPSRTRFYRIVQVGTP